VIVIHAYDTWEKLIFNQSGLVYYE